jgi:hypothetical protein
MSEPMRRAFEAWAVANHHAYRTERGALRFVDDDEIAMWTGWQGRAQRAAQPLSDEQIVEIRDEHLPNQGERFDCIAFARAVIAADREIASA